MTSREAAWRILEAAGEPLHYEEITRRILDAGYWETEGETPAATVNAQIAMDISKKDDASPFQRTAPGVYALRAWGLEEYETDGRTSPTIGGSRKVHVPLFPPYGDARHFLRVVDGEKVEAYRAMHAAIRDQTGTPQDPVNWQEPGTWIAERLDGEPARLARRFWEESGHVLNPRYTRGCYFVCNTYDLIATDAEGAARLTERGRRFVNEDADVLRLIDDVEGAGELLNILATKTRAMRGDLLPEWSDYLREVSAFGKPSTFKDTLRRRLVNLRERGLVRQEGNTYIITDAGLEYAATFAAEEGGSPLKEVQQALKNYNAQQRELLRERMAKMEPYLFEHLVRDLLEAMGYQDVEVTQQSGDKGVDVLASVQFGITEVREVVQVKRHQNTINRPKIDQLRGSLHYHNAIRGTIITLSQFSQGCKDSALLPGAPPITLIDGERLLDLLIELEVGIQKKPAVMYEVDAAFFDSDGEAMSATT